MILEPSQFTKEFFKNLSWFGEPLLWRTLTAADDVTLTFPATVAAKTASRPGAMTLMPTARRRSAPRTASSQASMGTLAPRSTTPKPRPRRGSASRLTVRPCWSPGAAPSTIVPRLRPRRANEGPRRPTRRWTVTVAVCSSAMVASPRAHRLPTSAKAVTKRSV